MNILLSCCGDMCLSCTAPQQLEAEPMCNTKVDPNLTEMDKKLDELKMEKRQIRRRTLSVREEAELAVKEEERLMKEKKLLEKEFKKTKIELDYFKTRNNNRHNLPVQSETKPLQDTIKMKLSELKMTKTRLDEKEEQHKKYKEKIRSLKKTIEDGMFKLGVCDGRIIELERDKAKVVADLESQRMKVRVFYTLSTISSKDLLALYIVCPLRSKHNDRSVDCEDALLDVSINRS